MLQIERFSWGIFMKVKEFEGNKIIISEPKLKIQTFVGSTRLSVPNKKTSATLENSTYEPEHFPGLIIRMAKPKAMILLFASGKLVCSAVKEQDVYNAIHNLKAQLNL
jgi:transcription initiation factor TFIID TATA-box-binding protein